MKIKCLIELEHEITDHIIYCDFIFDLNHVIAARPLNTDDGELIYDSTIIYLTTGNSYIIDIPYHDIVNKIMTLE